MSIILNGVITPKTSYGICTTNIILALERAGINVQAIPIGNPEWLESQNLLPSLEKGQFFTDSPCIRLFHEFDLSTHHGKGLHIGFPIFEKTNFSYQEIHQLNSVDALFVCTKWAKQMIEDNGITKPVHVVNLGVDQTIFKPTQPSNGPFRFFFPGKFEIRKGFDIVVELFERAFTVHDDIEILFLPFNRFIGEENKQWCDFLMSSSLASKTRIYNYVDTPEQVAEIYEASDCIVSFSRAEGWNLPLLEGLSCGKQIVATNYSAHTEYLTRENSYLVDVDGLEPALDGKWFTRPENNWALIAEGCKSGLIDSLREAYKQGKRVNQEGIETANRFTWDNTAKQIITEEIN